MSSSEPAGSWVSKYIHLPLHEWPLWARSCHARASSSVSGAAAISAHAASAGIRLPRGHATSSVASRLQISSVFSRLSHRVGAAVAAALDQLREESGLPDDSRRYVPRERRVVSGWWDVLLQCEPHDELG